MSIIPGISPAERTAALPEFDVRRFGAAGDGVALDTDAINRAIAAAQAVGGGTVVLPPGDYLSYSIHLCSHLTLELRAGATLIAADPPSPRRAGRATTLPRKAAQSVPGFRSLAFPQQSHLGRRLRTRDDSRSGPHLRTRAPAAATVASPRLSARWRRQPPGHLPDVLEADGVIVPEVVPGKPGPFGYPHALDTLPAGVGNKAIALRGCRHITVRELTILHGGHFAILAADCDNVVVDGVFIDTNRDGIDIDACANVRISNCSVNSPWDDGICVESLVRLRRAAPGRERDDQRLLRQRLRRGHALRWHALAPDPAPRRPDRAHQARHRGQRRLPQHCASRTASSNSAAASPSSRWTARRWRTSSSSNLTMRDVMNAPIFIRVAGRLRAPGALAPGNARRISISNVVAHNVAPDHGIFIAGLPGHPVSEVRLAGIQLYSRGGGTREDAGRSVPEMAKDYPEPMLFGALPAWGLYIRHAERVQLSDVTLNLLGSDARPAIELDDVADPDVTGLRLRGQARTGETGCCGT